MFGWWRRWRNQRREARRQAWLATLSPLDRWLAEEFLPHFMQSGPFLSRLGREGVARKDNWTIRLPKTPGTYGGFRYYGEAEGREEEEDAP